jgi:hypothetical protein
VAEKKGDFLEADQRRAICGRPSHQGEERPIRGSELARRLGVHERVVRRMLEPRHSTKAERIQAALAVLGKQMTVEVRDAA